MFAAIGKVSFGTGLGLVRFPNPLALALPRASESENLTKF